MAVVLVTMVNLQRRTAIVVATSPAVMIPILRAAVATTAVATMIGIITASLRLVAVLPANIANPAVVPMVMVTARAPITRIPVVLIKLPQRPTPAVREPQQRKDAANFVLLLIASVVSTMACYAQVMISL